MKVPTKWDELSEWQLRTIGALMYNNRNERVETQAMKKMLVVLLLLPSPSPRNVCKLLLVLCRVPLSRLIYLTDFMFDEKELHTRFPKYIKVGRWPFRKKLYGPAARMANSVIRELSYADRFYYAWETNNDPMDLHRLCAILYRPAGGNNPDDPRAPFSPLALERNADDTDKIPLHVKFMIAHVYKGCRLLFIKRHPVVFPQRKKSAETNQAKPKPYRSFDAIIDSMAMDEVQVFGSHQETERVYAPEFLRVYEESIKLERERESNRQRNKRK